MENELFEKAPIPKAYMKMALPVVMGMIVTLVYNLVDTYFIALTGNTDLIAGISLCAPLFTLLLAIGDIFGIGGSSVISRLLGAGEIEDSSKKSTLCFYSAIFVGIVFTVLMLVFKKNILYVLGATEQTYNYASQYYTWLILGSTFIIFSLVPSNLLRTEGAALTSMIGSVIGTIVNIILDPIFIFTLGFGAAGAAMATIIGYITTCGFFVYFIAKKSKVFSLAPSNFNMNMSSLNEILLIGLPSSITNLMQTIGITVTNRYLQPYGNDNIAVMGIVLKIVNIAVLVIVGLSFGGQPLIGYNYGAHNMKRLKSTMRFGITVTAGTAAFLLAVLSVLANPIVSGFLKDESLVNLGVHMLRFQLLGMPLMGICLIFICTFQSTGKGVSAFLLSACRQGIVYLPVIIMLSSLLKMEGVIMSQAIADVITTAIALFIFRKGLYKEIKNYL